MRSLRSWSIYMRLLSHVQGVAGRLEILRALLRAAASRLRSRRGALHVTRPVVVVADELKWVVPAFDNSFSSTVPGHDNNAVLPAIRAELRERPQPVVIDVGANLGFVSLPLARDYPGRRIVAVEPIPWLASALAESARLNALANLAVAACAIADGGEIALSVPVLDGVRFTALSSASDRPSGEAALLERERHVVPALTLDRLLDAHGIAPSDVALVKIDVEGYEAQALRTGPRALQAHPPVLFEALTGSQRADTEAVLRAMGYTAFAEIDDKNVVARGA